VNRFARLSAWLSVASLLGIVPHVMEDLRYGQAEHFHMTTGQFEWFSGAVVLATAAAAMASLAGLRWGAYAVLFIGVLWSVFGAADHYRAFLLGTFREGVSSRVWIWLLVGPQAAAALTAGIALRGSRE
jgi:hypothetical protein